MAQPRRRPRPLGAVVRAVGAPATPPSVRLSKGSCVVGSDAGCDLVVSDPTVSRRHVVLQLDPAGVSVQDLNSYNGVFHHGNRIEKAVLSYGGSVHIGSAQLVIDLDTESLTGELQPYEQDHYRGIVGASLAMRWLFAMLARLEGSLASVLIEGESGVGKELVANAIHEGSSASEGPMVVLNCGAIPDGVVASELFGHARGAFTGASEPRRGAFDRADGGTLFLDEIGELPLDVQPMLLRALESGEVKPVGSDVTKQVRVRVLAATNRELRAMVDAGGFREDLYYRLAVVRLTVPPLRERPEDIPALIEHFAFDTQLGELPAEVVAALMKRPWRGNVRELRNAMQAYAALGTLPGEDTPAGDAVVEGLLSQRVDVTRPYVDQKDTLIELFTRVYLRELLAHTGGHQTAAADLAGLSRTYLGRLLSKHGLDPKRFKP
jgi:transcriptional regulator with GAF, ATPase, and Fis domain